MIRWTGIIAVVALTLCVGAIPSGVSAAEEYRPSTADLLFRYNKIKRYLRARREHLDQLNAQIDELDYELIENQGRYLLAAEELTAAQIKEGVSARDREEAEAELARIETEQRKLYFQLLKAKRRQDELNKEQVDLPQQIDSDREQIMELDSQVARIEKQLGSLDRAYRRTLRVRTENAAKR